MNELDIKDTINKVYNKTGSNLEDRVTTSIKEIKQDVNDLSLQDIKDLSTTIIDIETVSLKSNLEKLLETKEAIERDIEKKYEELQNAKFDIFNTIEQHLSLDKSAISKLHQVKLQSIDLYDILSEMVESAILTALEKDTDGDIKESVIELVKEITFESIKEGSLNTIRVRKILSTILTTAIDIAEATPNRADKILDPTLRGMRSGLIKSIDRFKKRLVFMPIEAKHILIEDYDTIIEDLNQTDTLFSQVVLTQASQSTKEINETLIKIDKDMSYDIEELVHLSKETAELMKDRFSSFAKIAVKKADSALNSPQAKEAKRMGIQVFGVAKIAVENAIKSAKNVIDK